MNIKEKLNKINDLKKEINEYFDGMLYERLVDMTDQYWTVFGEKGPGKYPSGEPQPFVRADDVGWSDENPLKNPDLDDCEPEHIYSEEVQSVVRKDKYTLVCIRTSTGNGKEDLVFDNSLEISEAKMNGYGDD